MIRTLIPAFALGTILTASTSLQAGTAPAPAPATEAAEKSIYDKLWSIPVIYHNANNPIVEEFDLTGRFQLDYFNVNSNKGDNHFVEIRRFRLGVDSWWANRHLQLKATVDTNLRSFGAPSIFYNRMTDLYLNVHVNDAVNIRVGKFEPHFGYDREFSDNLQIFFERSFFDDQVFNNTGNDYVAGASVLGRIGNWGYQAAAFSDNVGKEFGEFNGGWSGLLEVSYDFSQRLRADKALWTLDYMHMENNARSNVFNTMQNAAATYFDYQKGRLGCVTQFGYGDGIPTKGNIYEILVMPSYYLIKDTLQLVLRYELGLASASNGITTLNRQVKTVGKFTGDTYNAVYVGLNYYLYGQKLKLMVGEQYANLGGGTGPNADYDGWTTLVGFRMFW